MRGPPPGGIFLPHSAPPARGQGRRAIERPELTRATNSQLPGGGRQEGETDVSTTMTPARAAGTAAACARPAEAAGRESGRERGRLARELERRLLPAFEDLV